MEVFKNRLLNAAALRAVKYVRDWPLVRPLVEKEIEAMSRDLEHMAKPYRGEFPEHPRLPEEGVPREAVLGEMAELKDREEARWRDGFVSGAVYHGDAEHIEFLNRVYALHSQVNPLHSDLWPSATRFEAEIVSMCAHMLGADRVPPGPEHEVVGAVSSGGTESILLAMLAYREHARRRRGIKKPEMVAPVTAHAAFDKACRYFGIRMRKVPVDRDFRADVRAVRKAVGKNTVVVVGSAPSFPHGAVDPIEEMSEVARRAGCGFHTDACLGGFVLPWAEKLGERVPPFDFRLPGVTSMSCDTHKYGYAAKGTSVVLYRGRDLRHHQFYTATDWPGGLYFSPTLAGSRPGALSAACWAAMVSLGEEGYLRATRAILDTAAQIRDGIRRMPELRVLGDPLWVIAFASDTLDIYQVMDRMGSRGWNLNGLHKPACVHLCVTLRHTRPGVAERFLEDLGDAVAWARAHPQEKEGMAPVYGMAASFPDRSLVGELLLRYLDVLYKV